MHKMKQSKQFCGQCAMAAVGKDKIKKREIISTLFSLQGRKKKKKISIIIIIIKLNFDIYCTCND